MSKHSPFVKPVCPTDLSAPGAVDDLLAFHRATFGGWRMVEGDGGGGGGEGDAGKGGSGDAGKSTADDSGYPAGTPVEQMTAPQREAYYKAQTQKWQGRAENSYSLLKSLGVKTPEEVAAIKDKIARHDALEHELMSDKDKAVAEAAGKAKADAQAQFLPRLVQAEFKAAAAGRIEPDRLATLIEPLDLSKFVDASGDVDTKKVAAFVEGLAPGKGNQQRPSGPTVFGLGTPPTHRAEPGAQGRAMAERRFGAATKS